MYRAALLLAPLVLIAVSAGSLHAQAEVSVEELDGTRTAIGVGIIHRAAWDRLYAVGTIDPEGTLPVDSATTFRAPGVTRVLLATSARALAASGQLDLDDPIGGILPDLEPAVGRVTLRQLLNHASGLDDATMPEGQTWDAAIGALDEGAFVMPPGEVVSYSRYSYPVAARVLEHFAGASLADLVDALILTPLGLESTTIGGTAELPRYVLDAETDSVRVAPAPDSVLGLPVTVTSSPDLLSLSAAWMAGGIPGSTPTPPALLPPERRVFEQRDGMTVTPNGQGASLSTGGLRWVLVPSTETASVRWTTGNSPGRTDFRVDARVLELSGVSLRTPRVPPESEESDTFDFGSIDDWVGTWRNGSVMFELRAVDGQLHIWDGRVENPMRHVGGGVLELDREGFGGAPIRLARAAGERVAFYLDLAYRLEGPPSG